jgi:hypothetical protein
MHIDTGGARKTGESGKDDEECVPSAGAFTAHDAGGVVGVACHILIPFRLREVELRIVGNQAIGVRTPRLHRCDHRVRLLLLWGTELEFVIMVIAVSCVKLLSAHNSTQHTSRKHKV